ncbi:ATP-grasp domain-containing protein [Nocardia sp. NPDC052566]|uniref:ATP-grasp domain-containing protein n=1 Tax=Nocardia sp. NPDC052566 TaxID=3364330 RepID=UPI0037C8B5D8
MSVNRHVVIVDSYAPTNMGRGRLLQEFRDAGYPCVRVQSSPEVPTLFRSSLIPDGYAASIVHDGDLEATVRAITDYQPVAVVPGSEVGVEFADMLSEALDLPTNGTTLSSARRDKFRMIETIKAAGVRGAEQLLVESEIQLTTWHREIGDRIVVKPIRGAAGAGVFFCDYPEEAVRAYRELLGSGNVFTAHNEAIVAQEYHLGTEYMVNTVSRDGHHHVCDIWKTSRITANGVLDLCDGVVLLAREGDVQEELVRYAYQVLDALGIRHGPAHLEIKLTPKGPRLVEVGARIVGGDLSHCARIGLGESQVEWTVDAYVRPKRFFERYADNYRLQSNFASVALISPYEGTLVGYPHLDTLKSLESVHEVRMLVKPGEHISRTVDDVTYPIIVNLRHDVEEVVLRDFGTIRYLDGTDFYRVAEPGPAASGR